MKETTNSIQRTCSTHLPSIKSWFIPVLLRTLCIMWQCTTVQWSGLHFVTLGGRGDSVRGGVRGSSSLKLLWRGVFWFLHLRGRPTCFFGFFFQGNKRLWDAFCCLFFLKSLGLVYHHGCSLTSASHCSSFGWMWSSHSWLDRVMVILQELASDGVTIKNTLKKTTTLEPC